MFFHLFKANFTLCVLCGELLHYFPFMIMKAIEYSLLGGYNSYMDKKTMQSVGIKELKDRLSYYVSITKEGDLFRQQRSRKKVLGRKRNCCNFRYEFNNGSSV